MDPGAASRASEAPPMATMTALHGEDSSSTMVSRRTSHMPCIRQNSRTTGVIKFQDIVPAASMHVCCIVCSRICWALGWIQHGMHMRRHVEQVLQQLAICSAVATAA